MDRYASLALTTAGCVALLWGIYRRDPFLRWAMPLLAAASGLLSGLVWLLPPAWELPARVSLVLLTVTTFAFLTDHRTLPRTDRVRTLSKEWKVTTPPPPPG